VVIRAGAAIQHFASLVDFVSTYYNKHSLSSRLEYSFAMLYSAVEFIQAVDNSMVTARSDSPACLDSATCRLLTVFDVQFARPHENFEELLQTIEQKVSQKLDERKALVCDITQKVVGFVM